MMNAVATDTTRAEISLARNLPPPEVSIVLPVWNERDSLSQLDQQLRSTLAVAGRRAEIIYVDDHSTDGSLKLLRELAAAAGPEIRTRVVSLRRNYGQTAALAAGFDLAEGEVIIPLDADGQNNPADIPRLLDKLAEGYDVVSGWRRARKDRLISRRIPSISANWLIGKLTGLALHDYGCTLKAYRAPLLKEIRLYGDMHRFLPVFLARLGARVTELEVDHRPRFGGESKYGSGRILKVMADLVHIRFISKFYTRPMHFFGRIAAWFIFATLSVAWMMLAFKFGWLSWLGIDYRASFVETPLPALAATFFLGAVSSLFFGILAEILIRIHHESSGVRAYAIRELEDSGHSLPGDARAAPRAEDARVTPVAAPHVPAAARAARVSSSGLVD